MEIARIAAIRGESLQYGDRDEYTIVDYDNI